MGSLLDESRLISLLLLPLYLLHERVSQVLRLSGEV